MVVGGWLTGGMCLKVKVLLVVWLLWEDVVWSSLVGMGIFG